MGCEKAFIRQLRERGFRLTPQREIILSVLHEIEGFASAEEIHARVRDFSSSVDLSTVYRTLDLLQGFGLVASAEPTHGQRRYELLGLHGPHVHLICQVCGKVMGVDPAITGALAERLAETHGFTLDVGRLSLQGWCRACKEAGAIRTEE